MSDDSRKSFGQIVPARADYTDDIPLGDVWKWPGLSPRDCSLIADASLILRYRQPVRSKTRTNRLRSQCPPSSRTRSSEPPWGRSVRPRFLAGASPLRWQCSPYFRISI